MAAKPVARTEHGGTREYPVEPHREAKPAVDSVDGEFVAVPAREQAKVDGTFGVDAPYYQRSKA